MVAKYSKSKSGRAALKDLLPDIDKSIEQAKTQAASAKKAFEELFKNIKVGTGVFGDFARDLFGLEKTITDYLSSIDTSTSAGVAQYADALAKVKEYKDIWLKEAKQKFQEEELGFEEEALSAQQRFFDLLDQQDGLYKQLLSLTQQREDLEANIADEQERRIEFQKQQNDLAQKEADIRKQIADVLKKAQQDENDIRRRGVLEAQLSIAQQKAIEISNVRQNAQDDIDKLQKEIDDLHDQLAKAAADEAKQEAAKDKDFERQKQALADQEESIRKATRLNDIRLAGARALAELEGGIFGMATDEYDLAARQNDIQLR
jgi:chromosome segregation ATPase